MRPRRGRARALILAAGVAAAVLPRAARAADPAVVARQAEKMLDEWRFNDARQVIAGLSHNAPDAALTLYVRGYQQFLEGDYARAIHDLSQAAQAAPADANARELANLATEAQGAIKDHKEERTGHFIIRYPPEDAVLVPYARDALEAAYVALHQDLGFEAELPIRVEFYRSPSDLAAVSSLSQAEVARTGTIALCKWARLMVTTPRALAYGYPWLDSINHELVHYAVSSLTRDRAPVWLQEGLAKFLERRWREPAGERIPPAMEHLLAKALRSGHLISFEAMHPSMAKLPSAEDATLAFAEVANAVAYLYQQAGAAGLRAAITQVAAGADARVAVAVAAHQTWPEFERGWRAFMIAQRYHTFAAIDLPTTHIRKATAIASRRKPSEDEALPQSLRLAAPYRFLRRGNIMLRHNRPRASVVEYEKGAKAVAAGGTRASADPSANWVFPVKLGRTYLALGEPDRALRAVAGVQGLYPELPWPPLIAGEALVSKGDYAAAVTALRASLATNPFDPKVHCALAEAYGKLPVAARGGADVEREQHFCQELAGSE